MNNVECKNQDAIDDDIDLFDDSLLAEFDNSAFKDKAPSTSKTQKTIANKSADLDTSELNVSALCCDEELSGYDKLSGKKWMYPINYPVRDYQFNIIQAAMVKNTLVSLPTGLGKTFIAAVLMYNFYRWYPLGKIIFTAPTRPLIAQQIEACYNIIAMPPDDTIEMTGGMSVTLRQEKWQTKRVFFATPQVVYNDIKSGICPAKKIRCLVFDEAHKAKSNYAYCQIVSVLTEMEHRTYRILGLSATPGSRINDVVQVVKNLHIAHLELRTEGCIDVAPYCHSRDIKIVVIPLGPELVKLRDAYIEVMDFYARKLKQMNILKANLGNLSKGRILMIYKGFQSNKQSHPQRGAIMKDLSQLISLYHGLEQLMYHGARAFLSFFDEQSFADKSWMQADDRLTALLERLRDDLGVNPLIVDPSTSVPSNLNFGHPKFEKVKEIIENHFKTAKADTRAIVYCEFHETVKLVHCLLSQCGAPIRPRKFVGQGTAGKKGRVAMPQREQLHVMEQFRTGACNVLVSTCVGEEGLDVGSVDLILCFDVATGSPVRLVQRCGRTGRARSGRVYILATEGKEHQTLLDAMRQRDSLRPKILQSREVQESLYKLNPRLIPYEFTPKCEKIYIKVRKLPAKETRKTIGGNKQGNNIKDKKTRQTLHNIPSVSNVNTNSNPSSKMEDDNHSIMSRLQQTSEVTNSPRKQQNIASRLISSFLSPKKEYMKETTISTFPSQSTSSLSPLKKPQKDRSKQPLGKSNKKNVDIRALFLTANKPNQKRAELVNELKGETADMPTHLLDLFIYLKTACETPKICYLCRHGCDCLKLQKLTSSTQENCKKIEKFEGVPIFPDINLIKSFNADLLLKCTKPKKETETVPVLNAQEEIIILDSQEDHYFLEQWHDNDVNKCCIENKADITLHTSHNFDIDDPVKCIKPKRESVPVLSAQEDIINLDTQEDSCFLEQWPDNDVNKGYVENEADITLHNSHNFDIGDPDDIFAMSPPQENKNAKQNVEVCSDIILPQSSVNFDLGSFDDILEASFESENKVENQYQIERKIEEDNDNKQTCDENTTIDLSHDDEFEPMEKYVPPPSKSPSILSGTRNCAFKSPILTTQKSPILTLQKSPILTTEKRSLKLKRRSHSTTPQSTAKKKLNLGSHDMSNSMLSITQTLDLINDESMTSTTQCQDERRRRRSPILLTQADRSKRKSDAKMIESIIIDDDDDSDSLPNNSHFRNSTSSVPNKRKIEDDVIASRYFNKKIKVDDQNQKANKSFKDKILAVLTSNNFNDSKRLPNDIINLNCKTSMPLLSPEILKTEKHIIKENKLDPRGLASKFSFCPKKSQQDKHELKENRNNPLASEISLPIRKTPQVTKPTPSHRTPKKKKPKSDFIDLEAELSGDECSGSGDELSDDSVGSIVDFITDKDVTHTEEDMQAHYLKSVKNPLKLGAFKIPELPKKFKNSILSQFVEPDSYEMDSFCVDSHIELTQSNDLTNLELAEMVLENERRQKKKLRSKKYAQSQNELYSPKISATQDDSPKIKRKNGKKYYVMSDSDDSS